MAPENIPCPVCGAAGNEPCRSAGGKRSDRDHRARVEAEARARRALRERRPWDGDAVGRAIAAHGKRVAKDGDEVALGQLGQLGRVVDDALRVAVAGMRERELSWANIGDALGVSKQAAQKRFGKEGER